MKKIDISKWNRKMSFEQFSSYFDPSVRFDVRFDVTALVNSLDSFDGFFIPFTYLLTKACNETDGFQYRYLGDDVIDCGKINASYTVLKPDKSFVFATTEYDEDYKTFAKSLRRDLEVAKTANCETLSELSDATRVDVVYFSCMPWFDFLSMSNPLPLGDKQGVSIPRLNWGKYVKEGERYFVTLSITANHAFVNGYDFGVLINKFQSLLDGAENLLK